MEDLKLVLTYPDSWRTENAIEFYIRKGYSFELLKKLLMSKQDEIKNKLKDAEDNFQELLKDDFCKIYHEYKNQNELTRIDFFAKKNNHYAKNRPSEFLKVYDKKIKQYNAIVRQIQKLQKFIWNDNELEVLEENYNRVETALSKRLQQAELQAQFQIQKKQEALELFLRCFKTGQQKFIFLIDDKHHLTNREDEINLYLTFGYEIFEPNPKDNKNFSRICLKPSANYEYTEDFEKALKRFFEKTNPITNKFIEV